MLGQVPNFVMDNLWYAILIASMLTWPVAWIADGAFKHNAFGLIGNYIILMIGSLGGAIAIMWYVGSAVQMFRNPHLPFFAAVGGACTLILLACVIKRLASR